MQNSKQNLACALPQSTFDVVRLGHGSGGKMTASLIQDIFLPRLGNEVLNLLDDAGEIVINGSTLAFTTDSYVVSPIFFPGGDIGSLAVFGTVNDLSMRGARPLFISATFILEEGLPIAELSKIADSVGQACKRANVQLIAADTKVVGKGAADKLFITTSGIGIIDKKPSPAANRAQVGDFLLVNGDIGRHGMAIMSTREALALESEIVSDSAPLNEIVQRMLSVGNADAIHCLRDITRGGLSGVLNELAQASSVGMIIDEDLIPIHPQVQAICELLGLDPLYVACEGRLLAIVSQESADDILASMKKQPEAHASCIVGRIVDDHPGRVVLRSKIGGKRILDKLSGEQLPRIC